MQEALFDTKKRSRQLAYNARTRSVCIGRVNAELIRGFGKASRRFVDEESRVRGSGIFQGYFYDGRKPISKLIQEENCNGAAKASKLDFNANEFFYTCLKGRVMRSGWVRSTKTQP